jgi:hypothetical protein
LPPRCSKAPTAFPSAICCSNGQSAKAWRSDTNGRSSPRQARCPREALLQR